MSIVRMSVCQSYAQHTFFCQDFLASICCYIISIAMCPSTYLSHSYTQSLPYVSVTVSLFLSVSLYLSLSVFTSLCRYIMCTIVFVCLSHSCHILVSTLTVRINLLNCVATHVSPLACSPVYPFVFCV